MNLSIGYITSRKLPEVKWFIESLATQVNGDTIEIVVVDSFASARRYEIISSVKVTVVPPKPSYWQGDSRLVSENWWAVANARNTFLCLAAHPFIAMLDDRSVLLPGWLDAVRLAIEGNYIVAGAYEKRTALTVENGVIRNAGIVTGEDSREQHVKKHSIPTPYACPGQWLFGCNLALPLEWALQANGYSETLTDGLSFEDVPFGLVLEANGFPIKFNPAMKIIEDRTPEFCGPVLRRTDRGVSPKDKSHKVLEMIKGAKVSPNPFNLRSLREAIQAGGEFPPPYGATTDWYDGMPIKDFV